MRFRRQRPSAFLVSDLPDFMETRGFISLGEDGRQIYVDEYRQRVESRILAIAEKHPNLEALLLGQEVSEAQLIDLERTLHRELGSGELELTSANIRNAYDLKVDNFLAFLRHILALEALPDYGRVVRRAFERHVDAQHSSADQIRFLRAVQEVLLQQARAHRG